MRSVSRRCSRALACLWALVGLVLASSTLPAFAAGDRVILLAATTTTDNSGLLGHLLPRFETASGIQVRTVVRGTGQALRLGENGDVDVLLVHHTDAEEAFVTAGHGVARFDVMYNDFVLVGPAGDPAKARDAPEITLALSRIAADEALFLSRGDDSGTHERERALWAAAGIDPLNHSGRWYREMGAGMGATLNGAVAMGAYALSDRASWLAFRNKADHDILVEGDPRLVNQYGVILVNPARHPHVKAAEGQAFVDWLLSPVGQDAIAEFEIDGRQAFFPNAAAAD